MKTEISANELRIGNWIVNGMGYERTVNWSILKIISTNPRHEYKPIKLTEQHLKDFGFEENEYFGNWHLEQYKIYSKDGSNIGFYENEFYWYFPAADDFYSWTKSLKYVHTLQNLYFALESKELTK